MTRMMKIDAISVNGRHRKDMGDLDALAASIADVGFLQPVAVDGKGKLIDGARRLEAAKQLGRESVPVHKVDDLDDVLRLMAERDANVCRKDFTPSEAVALGAQLEEMERKAARKRQSQAGPANGRGKKATGSGNLPEAVRGNTRDRVGAALGMSGKTYERAKEVVQAAKQNPAEFGEFVEEMDRTENVMQAYGKLYRRRREIEGERLARTMPIAQDQGIITGDMGVLWDRLEDNSVGLFLTDPPYDQAGIDADVYGRLGELAAAKLKPGGLCIAYTSQVFFPEPMNALLKHLDYWWIFSIKFTRGMRKVQAKNIFNSWRPILAFAKAPTPKPIGWIMDHPDGGGRDKLFHEWGQPQAEAEYFIKRLTDPGGLVVDPFAGGGTVPLACKATGRQWLATELNPTTAAIARKRMADVGKETPTAADNQDPADEPKTGDGR